MWPVLWWLDRGLAHVEVTIASAALAAGLLVSLYTISARAARVPTAEWVLELPMELLVVASIYGSGYLISQDRHLSVDVVVRRLPIRAQWWVALAVPCCLGLLCLFLAERAVRAAGQATQAGLTIPELFNLSAAVPLLVASIGFALWGFHFGMLGLKRGRGEEESSPKDVSRPQVVGPDH